MKKTYLALLLLAIVVIILGLIVFVLKGSGLSFLGTGGATPTLNITQAYQTVNAKLTQSVAQTPTATPSPLSTVTPLVTPTPIQSTSTATNTMTPIVDTPSARCNLAAPGIPFDVTIPDDTQMNPGQAFVKTWRLQNVGDCSWTTDYSLIFVSGEAMGAPSSVPFPSEVPSQGTVDLSVDMVAPLSPGLYQGYWKLRSSSGQDFGIGANGDAPFWVRIVVVEGPTPTLSATPSTPTVTPTPGVLYSGAVSLVPDDRLDLETGSFNSGEGEDVTLVMVAEGIHQLQTIGGALLGVYGESKPDYGACKASNPSGTFINVEAILPGTYLCYRTGSGLPGRALISSFNTGTATLSMEILTWSVP